jgi:[protein-PII] uridylyltransferase
MSNITDQRSIIDRRDLTAKLDAIIAQDQPRQKRRTQVLELFKASLAAGRAEVQRRFESKGNGATAVHENCFLIDQLIRIAYDFAIANEMAQSTRTQAEALTLVAVGGYGRGELSPQSDIDLLFLTPYKRAPWHEQLVEWLLYLLWDLGLKVGQATRSAEECVRHAKEDMTIRTALLEMRWLWGDQDLYAELGRKFQRDVVEGTAQEFFEAKLEERRQRHERMGDVRYVLEPNVKEGKGGLRDLHLLFWMSRYQYGVVGVQDLVQLQVISADAASRFVKAQNFLWTVRCHLHYLTGRPEDRLTFDVQPEIAERMGYTDRPCSRGVERFMKHFYLMVKVVGDLTRLFCSLAEERQKALIRPSLMSRFKRAKSGLVNGFKQESLRLNVIEDTHFEDDPVAMIRLFHAALENDLDIHPHALDLIHRNLRRLDAKVRKQPEAMNLFMAILTSRKNPEVALRHMNESGVLGRLIPDFGRVVAQMQYDMYHIYTVDEHTIQAIGILHAIENGTLLQPLPLSTSLIHKIHNRKILYMAVFLHDVAKGRNGDHSVLGAEVANKLGPAMGFNAAETETVAWLVRYHLLMSNTAFKRDIDDPKTISDFVGIVQSPERLKLLLLLTVVDIRAVGPTVWNAWKAGLLRELYLRAEENMTGDLSAEGQSRGRAAMESLRSALRNRSWSENAIDAHMALGYPGYWITFDTDSHIYHAQMIADATKDDKKLAISTRDDVMRGATEITVYTGDNAGLFSKIAGAMALSGVNIVDARIVTLSNGMALDTFWVQTSEGGPVTETQRIGAISQNIEQVLTGRVWLDKELPSKRSRLPSRAAVFKVPPRVIGDEMASATHTVIEVNGRDRPGLLYDLTATMTHQGLQISSAHVSTYGERVVDVFYVKDVFGHKVRGAKLEAVRKALLSTLDTKAAG